MDKDEAEALSKVYPYSTDEIIELAQIVERYISSNELEEIIMSKVIKDVLNKAVMTQIPVKSILGYMMGLWK